MPKIKSQLPLANPHTTLKFPIQDHLCCQIVSVPITNCQHVTCTPDVTIHNILTIEVNLQEMKESNTFMQTKCLQRYNYNLHTAIHFIANGKITLALNQESFNQDVNRTTVSEHQQNAG